MTDSSHPPSSMDQSFLHTSQQFLVLIFEFPPFNVFISPNNGNHQQGAILTFMNEWQQQGPARVVGVVQSRELAETTAQVLNGMNGPALTSSFHQLSQAVTYVSWANNLVTNFFGGWNSGATQNSQSVHQQEVHQSSALKPWSSSNLGRFPTGTELQVANESTVHPPSATTDSNAGPTPSSSADSSLSVLSNDNLPVLKDIEAALFGNDETTSSNKPRSDRPASYYSEYSSSSNIQPMGAVHSSSNTQVANPDASLPAETLMVNARETQSVADLNNVFSPHSTDFMDMSSVDVVGNSLDVVAPVLPPPGLSVNNQNNGTTDTAEDSSDLPSTSEIESLAQSCRSKEALPNNQSLLKTEKYVADQSFYIELRRMVYGKEDYLKTEQQLKKKFPEKALWIKRQVAAHFPLEEAMIVKRYNRFKYSVTKLRGQTEVTSVCASKKDGKVVEKPADDGFPSQKKVSALAMECRSVTRLNAEKGSETRADELFAEKLRLELFGEDEYLLTTSGLDMIYPGKLNWLRSQMNIHFPLSDQPAMTKRRSSRICQHLNNLRTTQKEVHEKQTVVESSEAPTLGNGGMSNTNTSVGSNIDQITPNKSLKHVFSRRAVSVTPANSKSAETGRRSRSQDPLPVEGFPTDVEVMYTASKCRSSGGTANFRRRADARFFVKLQSKLFQRVEDYGTDRVKQEWVWLQMEKHFPMRDNFERKRQRKRCVCILATQKRQLHEAPRKRKIAEAV